MENSFLDMVNSPYGTEEIDRHIKDYISDGHLKEAIRLTDGYIFKQRNGKKHYGYCTKCYHTMELPDGLKHNQKFKCPRCKKDVIIKNEGMGRTSLKDIFYLLYYRKSKADSKTIVGVGAIFERRYQNYRKIDITVDLKDVYIFTPGKGGKRNKIEYEWKNVLRSCWGRKIEGFKETKRCNTPYYSAGIYYYIPILEDKKSLQRNIKGLERLKIQETYTYCKDSTHVEAIDFCLRYPCVEYMYKMGQTGLIKDRVCKRMNQRGLVNWKGKTAKDVLGLTGQQLAEIKREKITLDTRMLMLAKAAARTGEYIDMKETEILSRTEVDTDTLRSVLWKTKQKPSKVIRYIEKQFLKYKKESKYISIYTVENDYCDYLVQCKQLDMDLKEESVCFPKDLKKIHSDLVTRVKIKQNKDNDALIRAQFLKLEKTHLFEFGGLLLRPAASAEELIQEGNALHHCVGNYIESYAKGRTIICVIRQSKKPEQSYYTAEFSAGKLVQCRGYKNTHYMDNKRVKALIEAFEGQIKNRRKAG